MFIELQNKLINSQNIASVTFEKLTIWVHLSTGSSLNFNMKKEDWNKAVREAGVPGLQYF